MKFKMIANVTFEATNIDDAFNKLMTHFHALETDTDNDQLRLQFLPGSGLLIEPIGPIKETTDAGG